VAKNLHQKLESGRETSVAFQRNFGQIREICRPMGRKGIQIRKKYIQSLPKKKRLQLLTPWVLDELEKHHFRHLTQNVQEFFKLQCQLLATSDLSPAGPQSHNIISA
jgi:hypothetical protein